jgi:hypothetical protein
MVVVVSPSSRTPLLILIIIIILIISFLLILMARVPPTVAVRALLSHSCLLCRLCTLLSTLGSPTAELPRASLLNPSCLCIILLLFFFLPTHVLLPFTLLAIMLLVGTVLLIHRRLFLGGSKSSSSQLLLLFHLLRSSRSCSSFVIAATLTSLALHPLIAPVAVPSHSLLLLLLHLLHALSFHPIPLSTHLAPRYTIMLLTRRCHGPSNSANILSPISSSYNSLVPLNTLLLLLLLLVVASSHPDSSSSTHILITTRCCCPSCRCCILRTHMVEPRRSEGCEHSWGTRLPSDLRTSRSTGPISATTTAYLHHGTIYRRDVTHTAPLSSHHITQSPVLVRIVAHVTIPAGTPINKHNQEQKKGRVAGNRKVSCSFCSYFTIKYNTYTVSTRPGRLTVLG